MAADIRKAAFAAAVGAFFLATSQDAAFTAQGHNHGAESPVCSDKPVADSVARMQAIQSLRETQVEVEMMKRHEAATAH